MNIVISVIFLLFGAQLGDASENDTEVGGYELFHFHWSAIQTPYMLGMWILVAAMARILFNAMRPLSNVFPDSSLLIVIGIILGVFIRYFHSSIDITLDSHAFFIYLLPPIIFDAGYFMPIRSLFENFTSVLVFSVVGTIFNSFAIGGSLLLLNYYNCFSIDLSLFDVFIFSSLISAVDPVAVIAVFEEIHVNEFLFVNVFGEALFNDAVTVVLYQMFKTFALIGSENLIPLDYGKGAISFFTVSLGGCAIGIIFAFLTALATKYTHNVKILAPVFIFVLPYLAYLTAEMFSLSSIIAIAFCGMLMKQYVKGNITAAADHSVKYFTKMMAQSSETVIFMFLGLSTISSAHYWDTWFVVATVVCCLLWRTVGVIIQCAVLNRFTKKQFSAIDQFILCYGGLRGAIAFGLASSMPISIQAKSMFLTTTIVVIFFTVFLQGTTIRPLVEFLNVEKKEERVQTMTETVYNKYLMYMMSGLEDIAGQRGHYSFMEDFERFNAKILRPILMRSERKRDFDASTIVRAYAKITLHDAMNLAKERKMSRAATSSLRIKPTPEKKPEISFEDATQRTVTSKDVKLEKFLEDQENVEGLYKLFSEMLDRKLQEPVINEQHELQQDSDIEDDYMQQMNHFEGSIDLRNRKQSTAHDQSLRLRTTGSGGLSPRAGPSNA